MRLIAAVALLALALPSPAQSSLRMTYHKDGDLYWDNPKNGIIIPGTKKTYLASYGLTTREALNIAVRAINQLATTQPQTTVPTIPPPATLQVLRTDCAAPVPGTVLPAGLNPHSLVSICVQYLANVPVCTYGTNVDGSCAAQVPPVATTPTWAVVASAGQTVTIKAGTQVRWGAPAGTPPGDKYVTVPLAADGYATFQFTADTTCVVGAGLCGGQADPARDYVKHLEMLSGTGSVTVAP